LFKFDFILDVLTSESTDNITLAEEIVSVDSDVNTSNIKSNLNKKMIYDDSDEDETNINITLNTEMTCLDSDTFSSNSKSFLNKKMTYDDSDEE
jgi:hypothetical protein